MHEAVILVGGRGTRLAPFTTTIPKPLLPLGENTILDLVLRQLRYYEFSRVTLAVGYMAPLFQAIFGDGKRFGLEIRYCHEPEPLGTVGPLSLMDDLGEQFIVMNGDTLTSLDYGGLLRAHTTGDAQLTIATTTREERIDFGVVERTDTGTVCDYIEKPTVSHHVSIGVYAFSRAVLAELERGIRFDLPDLVHRLLARGIEVSTFPFDGYWLDIGRHSDYDRAIDEFSENRHLLLPSDSSK